ncbi:hypothetical protein DPMN_193194, partial [Dreissena polymorpha]
MSFCRSVGPSTRWFPDDNSRTLGARIMKLHRYIDHDSKMTPIDFQVTRSKVKVTISFILSVEECCLGRKLLCKSEPVPAAWGRPTGPKLIPSSQICDGKTDCPLGEDESCSKCGDPPKITSGFRTDNQTFYPAGTVV